MKFSTDELMPFFEVRTGMSKHLDDVQTGKEIVITRHGKPEGALLSSARLFRYREHERVMGELLTPLKLRTLQAKLTTVQIGTMREAEQLLAKPEERV
jgi:antitoxin (DNA-binding transcriptional repressor) of toxin-antitoxin stability system